LHVRIREKNVEVSTSLIIRNIISFGKIPKLPNADCLICVAEEEFGRDDCMIDKEMKKSHFVTAEVRDDEWEWEKKNLESWNAVISSYKRSFQKLCDI
jgi:hypothetical protein